MDKTIAVLLAPGFEDLEALTAVDVFRRAGINVVTAAVATNGDYAVPSSHGVTVLADCVLDELETEDIELVYFPGGLPGSEHLASCDRALNLAREVEARGGWIAAICAAPIALDAADLLNYRLYTCYPGVEKRIKQGTYTGNRVEICEHIITACGPGASFELAFTILKCLGMDQEADAIFKGMQLK